MTPFPSLGTVVCGCDDDAACSYHAALLYPRPDAGDAAADDDRRQFADASRDFYIPGWTPSEEDELEIDRRIVDDMREEAQANPDMALALRMLYHDDVYSHAEYIRDTRQEAKVGEDACVCDSCEWINR